MLSQDHQDSKMENTVFFEPKSRWKYDIYRLLKSSCFEAFRDGKYFQFWDKHLMEKCYLLKVKICAHLGAWDLITHFGSI